MGSAPTTGASGSATSRVGTSARSWCAVDWPGTASGSVVVGTPRRSKRRPPRAPPSARATGCPATAGDGAASAEPLPLSLPRDRERLEEVREPCRQPPVQDALDDVGGEQREAQHAADVGP